MKPEVMKDLVCPECHGELRLHDILEQNGKIKKATLSCDQCDLHFPVVDFIPRFVSSQEYVESFGEEWHLFKRVKNDRMQMSKDEMKNYLSLEQKDIEGKLILEIGCGAGPYLEVSAANYNAHHVFGVDLSRAVDAAYENVGHLENVTVIQANLFKLPFRDEYFELMYSLGVLHHTPDTKEAFKAVCKKVKEGGVASVWVYGAYWLRKSANQDRIRQWVTSKLSVKQLYAFSKFASYLYYLYKVPFIGTMLRETFPIAMDNDKDVRALNTYDLYSPTYIHRHYVDEIYEWYEKEGFEKMRPSRYLLGMKAIKKSINE